MQITSGDMPMLSDLQLVYMVPRNSTELLKNKHYQISSGARASLGEQHYKRVSEKIHVYL